MAKTDQPNDEEEKEKPPYLLRDDYASYLRRLNNEPITFPYKPPACGIKVNDPKELRDKFNINDLPPKSRLAIKSALNEYLRYLRTLPQFSELREFSEKRRSRGGDSLSTDKTTSDE